MQKIVIGNLKMNILTIAEREQYFSSFSDAFSSEKFSDTKIVICPPFVHLEKFAEKIGSKNVAIGAQNIFWEEKGSFTGEVSPQMIKSLGAQYSIVGHSERRKYFGETDETSNLKIKALVNQDIVPIYCVGETQEQRSAGDTADVIMKQVKSGLADVAALSASGIIIAYEPVWAVGSDSVPTSDEILEVKILLKRSLSEMFGLETAEKIKLLYGGSVKSTLVDQVCIQPGMDGVLVGRESLTPSEFIKIVETVDKK